MKLLCTYCREAGHVIQACPEALRFIAVKTEPDEPPTDAEEATQNRIHALRAALRGVLVDARRFGWVFTPETAALVQNADSFDGSP